jgi:ferritin-like metal-binding protein YciE
MPKEPNTAEQKLIQYLNQAYGKEKQLETALQAHIGITSGVKGRDAYAKRLKEHLKETKAHAKNVERRIKKLGGVAEESELPGPDVATTAANTAMAAAGKLKEAVRGPLHTLRGTSPEELLVKNAQTELSEEFHEIAIYTTIETMAEAVGDKETAKLARDHKRQEQRMATFLEKQIPVLTKAVATTEIPASERNGGRTRRRSSSGSRSSGSSRSRSGGSSRSRSSGSRSRSRGRSS